MPICESRPNATTPSTGVPCAPADAFDLFDLRVEVVPGDRPFVCGHRVGDYFLVEGENLIFPEKTSFSMYALAALLPLLPAKQRPLQENDWMLSDALIACPDPNCGARFKVTRTARRTLSHAACTVVPTAAGDPAAPSPADAEGAAGLR